MGEAQGRQPRVAVIGGGITGLGAAYALKGACSVTLFEAEPRLGGHARTKMAGRRGDQPVDTGFIVFNHATYPQMTALFSDLDVPIAESDMSFAASIDGGRVEYALRDFNALFAQRRNAIDPRFWRMLRDIQRFNARAEGALRDEAMTIGTLIAELGLGRRFRDHYLLPFSGAIWSTPARDILDFPAAALVRFFRNHALLSTSGQHQWYTVRGGSLAYVQRMEAALTKADVHLRPACPVRAVTRDAGGIRVAVAEAEPEVFDEVVLATHADDTVRLLADAKGAERSDLAAVAFQPNEAVLHADPAAMPQRRRCWSSWNYVGHGDGGPITLTYWMNALQPIPKDDPLFVTLNPTGPIRDDLVHDVTTFRHPRFDADALAAQASIAARNGARGTWVCGAWMGNGFHEDGLVSGQAAAAGILARYRLA